MNFVKEKKSPYRRILVSFNKPKPTVYHNYPSIVAGNAILLFALKKMFLADQTLIQRVKT
jgi:hypothetical protein